MKLFRVNFRRIFENFYVEASSFEDASEKVINHLKVNMSEKYRVHEDGGIEDIKEKEKRIAYVNEIVIMSDFIIK